MPEINIPWPEKGISEGRANDEQTPRTTRDAVNVRSVDPTNGRVRGAQRSGMSLYGRDPIAASQKVQDIFSVTYDNKNTDYAAQPLETSGNTSSVTPPNKSSCWQLVLDNQGNVYGIDGKAAIDWGVYGAPETFVIDQKGVIRYKQVGPFSPEIIRDELLPLLKKLQQGS